MERSAKGKAAMASKATKEAGVGRDQDGGNRNGGARKMKITVEKLQAPKVTYKVRRDAPLSKVMFEYCQHMGLNYKELKFTYLGKEINDFDTPDILEMEEEEDVIDCWPQLEGGAAVSV